MNISTIKTIILSTLLLVLLPQLVFAQTSAPPRAIPVDERTLQPIQINTNNQAGQALKGSNNQAGISLNAGTMAGSLGTCIGASGITSYVKRSISAMVGSLIGGTEVPTADNSMRSKEVGTFGTAYISWDSLGYCAINSVIEAIGAATVNWINNGFKGNPVFVDDPSQFFSDIADIEAGQFLNDISNGFLCSPIQNIVRVNLSTRYNNSLRLQNQCTFSAVSGNLEQFMSGETFSWDDYLSYTQNPYNNPYGATIYGGIDLDQRIAASLGVQSKLLEWGRGFLSFKDPETGKISSPGAVIEGQINQRLFNGESRLKMADEFDEIVNALVNQLIKVAINEVTGMGKSSGSSGGNVFSGNYQTPVNPPPTPPAPPTGTTTRPLVGTVASPLCQTGNPTQLYSGDITLIDWNNPDQLISKYFKVKDVSVSSYYGSGVPKTAAHKRNAVTLALELDKIEDQWGDINVLTWNKNDSSVSISTFSSSTDRQISFESTRGLSVNITAANPASRESLANFLSTNWSGPMNIFPSFVSLSMMGQSKLSGTPSCAPRRVVGTSEVFYLNNF